ncbi:MAG TPA: hypothetical protein VFZ11_03385 [Gemmatimonadaceae bacterium]
MRDEKHERADGSETPAAPEAPAKEHGDVLDDLIPRDLRESEGHENGGRRSSGPADPERG